MCLPILILGCPISDLELLARARDALAVHRVVAVLSDALRAEPAGARHRCHAQAHAREAEPPLAQVAVHRLDLQIPARRAL
eukprot:2420202-Rhodomonas_salina.2